MGTRFRDHLIICGINRTSLSIIEELEMLGRTAGGNPSDNIPAPGKDYIVVDLDEIILKKTSEKYDHFEYVVGDASDDQVLKSAGIDKAYGIFPALNDNKENIFITFTARRLNPRIRIVARGNDIVHIGKKFRQAGADTIVSPNFIGGMRMVSELVRPDVVTFLDQLLRQKSKYLRLEELKITGSSSAEGRTLGEISSLFENDLQMIALKKFGSHDYIYNPKAGSELSPGDIFVVLGDIRQIRTLKTYLRNSQPIEQNTGEGEIE